VARRLTQEYAGQTANFSVAGYWCDLLNGGVRWPAQTPLAIVADEDKAGNFRFWLDRDLDKQRGGGSPVFLGTACSVAVTNELTTN
jgi:hypothetical protein